MFLTISMLCFLPIIFDAKTHILSALIVIHIFTFYLINENDFDTINLLFDEYLSECTTSY